MGSLRELVEPLNEKQRRYLIWELLGLDSKTRLELLGVSENFGLELRRRNQTFKEIETEVLGSPAQYLREAEELRHEFINRDAEIYLDLLISKAKREPDLLSDADRRLVLQAINTKRQMAKGASRKQPSTYDQEVLQKHWEGNK